MIRKKNLMNSKVFIVGHKPEETSMQPMPVFGLTIFCERVISHRLAARMKKCPRSQEA